jgi:hypothetical protein
MEDSKQISLKRKHSSSKENKTSPKVQKTTKSSNRAIKGAWINQLSSNNLRSLCRWMKLKQIVVQSESDDEWYVANDVPAVKDKKGRAKSFQLNITGLLKDWMECNDRDPLPPGAPKKQLIHIIWWRAYTYGHPLVDPALHISHLDKRKRSLRLIQESPFDNESRKYCHARGLYFRLIGERRRRCPHWENRCSGPFNGLIHAERFSVIG